MRARLPVPSTARPRGAAHGVRGRSRTGAPRPSAGGGICRDLFRDPARGRAGARRRGPAGARRSGARPPGRLVMKLMTDDRDIATSLS